MRGYRFTSIKPSEELETALVKARVAMIIGSPFFGQMVMRLQVIFVPDEDELYQTAATDGRYLIVNGKFFMALTPDERQFLLGHELGHAIFSHAGEEGRRLDRDPAGWNIAADHVVNNICVESKIGTPITSNGFKIFCDPKYKDWSVEMVYDDIMPPPQKGGGGNGKQNGGGGQQPGKGGGSGGQQGKGGGGQVLDEHLETGSIRPTGKDANGNDTFEVADPKDVTEAERSSVQREVRSAVQSAAQAAAAKSAGSVPAGIQRMIDEWAEPQIDWRDLLASSVSEAFVDDYTYARPSKKSWATNVILPGHKEGEYVELAAALDMSGSIGQAEATAFLSEVHGIMQLYSKFKIHLWCYDTQTYNYQVFTDDNLDDIRSYQVAGGGGTDFQANYDFMRELELVPRQFVNFTDGYPNGSWGEEDYTDSIFVLTTRVKPPFGRYARFEDV